MIKTKHNRKSNWETSTLVQTSQHYFHQNLHDYRRKITNLQISPENTAVYRWFLINTGDLQGNFTELQRYSCRKSSFAKRIWVHLSSLYPKYILYREGNQATLAMLLYQSLASFCTSRQHKHIHHHQPFLPQIANPVLYHIVTTHCGVYSWRVSSFDSLLSHALIHQLGPHCNQ